MYIFTWLFLVENVLWVVLCSHYRLFYLLKSQMAAFNLWNHFVPYCFFNSIICVIWSLRSTVPISSQQDRALALPCYSGDFENEIYFFFLKPNHLNWSQCQIQILLATLAQKQLLCLPKEEILPQRWHLVIVGEKDFLKKKKINKLGNVFCCWKYYTLLSAGGETVCVRVGRYSSGLTPLRVNWNILQ